MPRIYADVETTGYSSSSAVIVELAAVAVGENDQELGHFESLVHASPEELSTDDAKKALEVNGIKPEDLAGAPRREDVAAKFRAWLIGFEPPFTFHSFNNGFDRRFLERSPWDIALDFWGECVMQASRNAMSLPRWPNLEAAVAHFGLTFDGPQHRALPDARAAARLHGEILKRRVHAS